MLGGSPSPRRLAALGPQPAASGGPRRGGRIHSKRVAAGVGSASGMEEDWFGLGAKAQKDFIEQTIMNWLPREPRAVRALEWFPDDDRANLKTILQNVAVFDVGEVTPPYYVAGCNYSNSFQDNFGKASFSDWIRVKVCNWEPGRSTTLADVADDHLDMVICGHNAVKRIGAESFAAAVSDTHRILKPNGDFMLFMPDGEVPPANAEDLFSLEQELGGGEFAGGLSAYRLQPLKQAAPARLRKRRRRRRIPVEPGAQPPAAVGGGS